MEENEIDDNDNDIEDQLELKQELLKSEIVDKDYDPNKFLKYCLDQKENGDDMNNWTYDELKQCVGNFIESQNKKPKENLQEGVKKEEAKEKEPKENEQKENEVKEKGIKEKELNEKDVNNNEKEKNEQKDNIIETNKDSNEKNENNNEQNNLNEKIENAECAFDSFITELPCKILEKSHLNNKEIKVTVKNPKTIGKGFSTHVTYEVFTEPSCWTVRRRYNDFIILRQLLSKYYPRNLLPPLPDKKSGKKRFNPNFLERRMKFLQLFINDVINNESFKANESLTIFLNYNDHTQFEKKMKELNNYNSPQNFDDLKTLTGKIKTLEDNYSVDQYFTSLSNFSRNQKQIYTKLNNSIKMYCRYISSACQSLEEISKSFGELHNLNLDFGMKDEVIKSLNILNYFFKEKREIMFKENEMIHEKIKQFFKLQRLQNNTLIDLIDNRGALRQKFIVEKNKLLAKKEKLYAVKDINKWEINSIEEIDKPLLFRDKNYAFQHMCAKDSQIVNNIYKHLTNANYMNYVEFKNINNKNQLTFVEVTKEFARIELNLFNEGMKLWEKLNTYI